MVNNSRQGYLNTTVLPPSYPATAPVLEGGKHDGIGNIHLAEQPFQQHIALHALRFSHIAENGGKRTYS